MKLIVRLLWYLVTLWRWDHQSYDDIEYEKLKEDVEDYLKEN